jgi:acylphosphatase
MIKTEKPKCHSLVITGKVQDIGFRSIVEHIGRSFGMPGMVFNAKDGSVNILCSGADSVIESFTQTIKVRGEESGAQIEDIIKKDLHDVIALPEHFTKVPSDDEPDIGRKLDTGVEVLKDIKGDTSALVIEMRDHNKEQRGHNTRLEEMVTGINDHNTRLEAHNTRLEAILQKLADKA